MVKLQKPAEPKPAPDLMGDNSRAQLFSFVERIERLAEEKAALAADIKEVFSEVKACGYDTKTLRSVISRRKLDTADRMEMDSLLDLYESIIDAAEKKARTDSIAEGA